MAADDSAEDLEISLVLEAIQAKYGYDLREYARSSMRRRVLAALARSGSKHLGELQHRLLTDQEFFASVLDDLTVGTTEMFRDPAFYRAFREHVVPVLCTYPQLKIWHAGCSSGEEVYSTAILLTEAGLYDRTQLYATDVSPRALDQARDAIYPARKLPLFKENYEQAGGSGRFEDYYASAYDRIALTEALRKNVVFFQHNLVSDHSIGEMHAILCRNVLIYFGPNLHARVMAKLAMGLCRGGFLCLGTSERLLPSLAAELTEVTEQQRIYRRRVAP
jgi:chemotaxis protein methyltransferase CheR